MDPETEYLFQSLAWASFEIVHFKLSNVRPHCSKKQKTTKKKKNLREKNRWLYWRMEEHRAIVISGVFIPLKVQPLAKIVQGPEIGPV